MPKVLYTGKLPPLIWLGMNANCAYAWITGYARDAATMTNNIKRGYEGEYTDDIHRYDEMSADHYMECAELLLEDKDRFHSDLQWE